MQALALVLLNSYGKAYNISLVFFAFQLLQIGYLTFRSAFLPRWLAFVGFTVGLVLLLVITEFAWIALLFPLWVLLVSAYILISDLRDRPLK